MFYVVLLLGWMFFFGFVGGGEGDVTIVSKGIDPLYRSLQSTVRCSELNPCLCSSVCLHLTAWPLACAVRTKQGYKLGSSCGQERRKMHPIRPR